MSVAAVSSGMLKWRQPVECGEGVVYLSHRGVQLILAYSWARLAILVAGKGRGEYFISSVSTSIPVPLSSLSLSFISPTIYSISFLPLSGRRHKMIHEGWRVVKAQHHQKLWVKFSADGIFIYFSYFPQKKGFDISCKLSPLHEMSKPVFWGKKKNISICRLLIDWVGV